MYLLSIIGKYRKLLTPFILKVRTLVKIKKQSAVFSELYRSWQFIIDALLEQTRYTVEQENIGTPVIPVLNLHLMAKCY